MNEVKTSIKAPLLALFTGILALSIAVMFGSAKTACADDTQAQVVTSWQIGSPTPSDVVATLYDDGTLVFSGSGDTKNYSSSSRPDWHESHRADIKSVVFEEGVTPDNLSYYFGACTNLSSLNRIPDSVTNMAYAFQGCSSLVSIPNFPASLTNLTSTFASCRSLSSVPEIPEGTTLMGNTFSMCTALKSAPYIPSTVTNLNNAFTRCKGLTVIPKGWGIPEELGSNRALFIFAIKDGMDAPYGKNNKLKTYCDPSDYERLSANPRLTWDAWNRELISGYPDASDN